MSDFVFSELPLYSSDSGGILLVFPRFLTKREKREFLGFLIHSNPLRILKIRDVPLPLMIHCTNSAKFVPEHQNKDTFFTVYPMRLNSC